jgi:membrane-bound lytic murein transglycosylase MltF
MNDEVNQYYVLIRKKEKDNEIQELMKSLIEGQIDLMIIYQIILK